MGDLRVVAVLVLLAAFVALVAMSPRVGIRRWLVLLAGFAGLVLVLVMRPVLFSAALPLNLLFILLLAIFGLFAASMLAFGALYNRRAPASRREVASRRGYSAPRREVAARPATQLMAEPQPAVVTESSFADMLQAVEQAQIETAQAPAPEAQPVIDSQPAADPCSSAEAQLEPTKPIPVLHPRPAQGIPAPQPQAIPQAPAQPEPPAPEAPEPPAATEPQSTSSSPAAVQPQQPLPLAALSQPLTEQPADDIVLPTEEDTTMEEKASTAAPEERPLSEKEELRRRVQRLKGCEEPAEQPAEEACTTEEAPIAEDEHTARDGSQTEEARIAKEERKAEEARIAGEQRKAEKARKAEEARIAEEARKAEEARAAGEAARLAAERQQQLQDALALAGEGRHMEAVRALQAVVGAGGTTALPAEIAIVRSLVALGWKAEALKKLQAIRKGYAVDEESRRTLEQLAMALLGGKS